MFFYQFTLFYCPCLSFFCTYLISFDIIFSLSSPLLCGLFPRLSTLFKSWTIFLFFLFLSRLDYLSTTIIFFFFFLFFFLLCLTIRSTLHHKNQSPPQTSISKIWRNLSLSKLASLNLSHLISSVLQPLGLYFDFDFGFGL